MNHQPVKADSIRKKLHFVSLLLSWTGTANELSTVNTGTIRFWNPRLRAGPCHAAGRAWVFLSAHRGQDKLELFTVGRRLLRPGGL